jgi:large subunit ribosomal protein L7e
MSLVPESFKRKAARDAKLKAEAATAAKAQAETDKKLVAEITDKAKSYEEEYLSLEKVAIDSRRKAKANNEIFVPPEEKLVFVIRVRGINAISPKTKKILQLLRLRQVHNGVFIRVNAATTKMLRLVEPYIAYGNPNLKSVKDLIYKRGYAKLSGQRIPLSSNEVVSAALGDKGIVCIEDIVHEIFTVGPNFKEASNTLWPFKLSSPKHGFRGTKLNHFNVKTHYAESLKINFLKFSLQIKK